MLDLIKSELTQFRGWALALAGVHLVALGFMARVVDLAQQPLVVHWVIGGLYALVGLLFGLYQLGSYRKPSQWLNLLHRPMPPHCVQNIRKSCHSASFRQERKSAGGRF